MSTTVAASATAVIQFIGLFVFSTKWSDHRIAIAPRVSQHMHVAKAAGRVAIDHPLQDSEVEPHAAIIMFPACSYISSRGWAPTALERVPGFLYVRLDGERVTFTNSNTARRVGKLDQAAARFERPGGEDELQLPHLSSCFKGMETLKPGFAPPSLPSSPIGSNTTAVFDLPSQSGSARACRGNTSTTIMNRIDTVVTMNIDGDLIISATNMNKQIELQGDTHVLIANIEASFIDPSAIRSAVSAHHYEVYFNMGMNNSGLPQDPQGQLSKFACATAQSLPCVDTSAIRQGTASVNDPGLFARVDYECSNTQWP